MRSGTWNVTYVREDPFRPNARRERDPPRKTWVEALLAGLRAFFALPARSDRA